MRKLILIFSATVCFSQTLQLKQFVFSSRAVVTSSDSLKLTGTLGQSIQGISSSESYNIVSGFWVSVTKQFLGLSGHETLPANFSVSPAYPNPFNPVTNIKYTLPSIGLVEIKIYDITGRIVDYESRHYPSPGTYQFRWNGTDKNGKQMSSGIYFISISQNKNSLIQKLTLIK